MARQDLVLILGGEETLIRLFNFRGEELQKLDTKSVIIYSGVFGCKFLLLRSWMSECKILTLQKLKLQYAMRLGDHKSILKCVDSDSEEKKAISLSEDSLR